MSGARIRQKFAKKRSLHGVNEHFSQIFNAIIVPRSNRAKVSCSVNWSEVVKKTIAAGVDINGMREDLEALGLRILPFSAEEAELAAQLWQQTRQAGLSLGDRACLSVGLRMNASVLTADQIWATLNLPVVVRCIR